MGLLMRWLVAPFLFSVCCASLWGHAGASASSDPPRLVFDAFQIIPGTDKPQLECVGGSAQGSDFEPQIVECVQRNTKPGVREWECEAHLGPFVNFEDLEVFCIDSESVEKYKNGGEHRCGLKYNLNYTDETTLTGSFVTVLLGLIVIVFVARQRRPPAYLLRICFDEIRPGSGNTGAGNAGGGVAGMAGAGGGGGAGSPANPKVLKLLAYGIFGVVALATILFSAIIFYLCTSVSLVSS